MLKISFAVICLITSTCLVSTFNALPAPQPKEQSRFFEGLFGWGGGGHGGHNHNHHGGQRPGPIQALVLGYVAQQALDYYFGGGNEGGCSGKKC